MTKPRRKAVVAGDPARGLVKEGKANVLTIVAEPGVSDGELLARATLDPVARHANIAASFGNRMFGEGGLPLNDSVAVVGKLIDGVKGGDLSLASRTLAAQAITLDAMFTEFVRRAGTNMGSYPDAVDRYMRLAFKAQSNCRTTLEALTRLHQPREQVVKHVHVNGGQAVVADQFHHHGGQQDAESTEQSHATGAAGVGPSLPSPDPCRGGVPVASGEGQAPLPDARRD